MPGQDTVDQLIENLQDLRIVEADLLQRLVVARANEPRVAVAGESTRTGAALFRIGDRVKITNKIRSPFGRNANPGDRSGAVIKITPKRVFILTDGQRSHYKSSPDQHST